MTRSSPQSGSSFFLILIGIAIFAALSYAVLQGGRVSQASLTADQARLAAQDIIQYADTVGKAVQALRLRGCSANEISFAGHPNGVANPSAPTDESCHVFSISGGKATPKSFDAIYHMGTNGTSGVWRFSPNNDFIGVGTNGCADDSCTELIIYVRDVKRDICTAIEKILSNDTGIAEVVDIDGSTAFAGTYDSSPAIMDDVSGLNKLSGRGSACVFDSDANHYAFYQVLIAR